MLFRFIYRTKSELQIEKQKDFKNVVLTQIIIIVFGLTISGFLVEGSQTSEAKLAITVFNIFGIGYSFLLWDLLRNFTKSQTLINSCLIILVCIVILGTLLEFPYYTILHVPDRRLALLLIHGLFFPIELIIIGFCIRDIFSGEFLTPDKLWGSACVFLMIGLTFASLFHLICIIKPGSLVDDPDIALINYSECVYHSLAILGGMDPDHPNASRLIRNISVMEAVWSNLFVVLIIGKLMGLPRLPKPESKQN
ncbi:MAG TPA: hypothetical protein PLS08_05105 [Chryseolinea sp.]|nr:hypothetical protein [Chryseolinea sp.]